MSEHQHRYRLTRYSNPGNLIGQVWEIGQAVRGDGARRLGWGCETVQQVNEFEVKDRMAPYRTPPLGLVPNFHDFSKSNDGRCTLRPE
jgi:hypothetical protein